MMAWLNNNAGAIQALGSVVLVGVTIALVLVTNKYVKSTAKIADATADAAVAARESAASAAEQARSERNPAVSLAGATGIISKAERLKGVGALAQKHMGYMTLLGQLRNAADHGIDPDVNRDWVITPEVVRLASFTLISATRSIVALSLGRAQF